MSVSFHITEDNTEECLEALEDQIAAALEEIGLAAEGYAKRLCAVDTGLLRNSITHALDGESASVGVYRASKGSNRGKNGERLSASSKNAGSVGVGYYSGSMPKESGGKRAVYIGTNVEYAPYVELGTSRTRAQPFIKPAVEDHKSTYQGIIKRHLQG